MALGLGVLKLAPRDFWSLSLPELNAAIMGMTGVAWADRALTRKDFGALMRRFPDKTSKLET